MAEDIIKGYVGKTVVLEIDPRAIPAGTEYSNVYVGRIREYDGSFIEIGPFVRANAGPNIDDTIALLEKEFSEQIERAGNLPPKAPKVLAKNAIAGMALSHAGGNAEEKPHRRR